MLKAACGELANRPSTWSGLGLGLGLGLRLGIGLGLGFAEGDHHKEVGALQHLRNALEGVLREDLVRV